MSDTRTSPNRLGAVGIAVSDLDRSAEFYRSTFGMVDTMTFDLAHMREIVLGFPGSSSAAIVLMQYIDGSDNGFAGNPLKLVMYVTDTDAIAAAVSANGGRVTMPPKPFPDLGATVGFVTDPDGHLIEIIHR